MITHEKTVRLARLIGLDYHVSDVKQKVWRQVKRIRFQTRRGHGWTPWQPHKCEPDLEPIKAWLKTHHPGWQRTTGCDVERDHCEAFCDAVLDVFDPTPEPDVGLKCATHDTPDQRGPACIVSGTVLTGYTFHGPFTTIDAASSWLAAGLPRKLGVCTDAIVLLEPPEPTELAAERHCACVPLLRAEIERLTADLVRAKSDAETYLLIGQRRGTENEILKATLADAYHGIELAESALAGEGQEIEHLREQLADIANATTAAMDERCDADEKHCACVPLLRAEVRRLAAELAERTLQHKTQLDNANRLLRDNEAKELEIQRIYNNQKLLQVEVKRLTAELAAMREAVKERQALAAHVFGTLGKSTNPEPRPVVVREDSDGH